MNDKTKLKFRILECAQPEGFGYVNDEFALKLMEEGYLEFNPKEEWYISGYKTTQKGTRWYERRLKGIRTNHGHVWKTYFDCHKEGDNTKPYELAFSKGYHNGFVCKVCGESVCNHCTDEWDVEKCPQKTKENTEGDDDDS